MKQRVFSRTFVVIFAAIIFLFLYAVLPTTAGAVMMEADQKCIPADPDKCICSPKYVKNKGCVGAPNNYMCPCIDNTNGYSVSGKCVATNKCQAMSTSDGKLDQGMSKLGEMLGKLMEALKGKDGGGGEQPSPTDQGCVTLQPTPDKTTAEANPMCYYYQPDPNAIDGEDPSGGLVATPTSGDAPLTVYFAFTNGTSGCGTPALKIEFGDGEAEDQQVHTGTCKSSSETTQHVYTSGGQFAARLKKATTGEVRGGVNITVNGGVDEDPTPDDSDDSDDTSTGGSSSTGGSASTGGTNSNIGSTLFTTPLTNLGNTGSLTGGSNGSNGSNSTGGTNSGGGVSTGGSNFNNQGASLNFNSPQSIVQSIIAKNLPPGAYGDVKILDNGTTIIAGVRENNTEVAGFYGTSGAAGQGQGAVARLCATRPWSRNFLSFIIPASFFDSLCSWRGYSVGAVQQQTGGTTTIIPATTKPATVKTTVGGSAKTTTQKPATTTPAVQTGKVDIWASPATVPLGARTSIFWNTQGVTDCIETSPDGGFSHATLKGGASTVPLTQATTFTISCVGSDGKPVTDNVTVMIAL